MVSINQWYQFSLSKVGKMKKTQTRFSIFTLTDLTFIAHNMHILGFSNVFMSCPTSTLKKSRFSVMNISFSQLLQLPGVSNLLK